MADNPHVNKVDLADGSTLIDLTGDTATESDVVSGKTFHLASGATGTGSMDVAGSITDAEVDSVLADEAPTGTASLRLSQLSRFFAGLKSKFTNTKVKGNAESSYRTGDVNLTPANIGAASKSEAIKSISRSGTTFTATRADDTTFTFTQQDNDTTYPTAITNITRSGTTFTATRANNTTFTFSQQDNNTTYSCNQSYGTVMSGTQIRLGRSVLYNNTSGTTGNVTLSATAANYNHMSIYYRASDSNNQVFSTDVYSPNGKVVTLFGANPDTDGVWINCSHYTISGTSMTRKSSANGRASGNIAGNSTVILQVLRVEAWNE